MAESHQIHANVWPDTCSLCYGISTCLILARYLPATTTPTAKYLLLILLQLHVSMSLISPLSFLY